MGWRVAGGGETVPETGGELRDGGEGVGVRLFVNPVQAGNLEPVEVAGHRLVGGDHELLDDTVGHVALGAADVAYIAHQVEVDLGLGQVEVDAAPLLAQPLHLVGQFLHEAEGLGEARQLRQFPVGFIGEGLRHLPVSEAGLAADDGLEEVVAQGLALLRTLHEDGSSRDDPRRD